jgi:polyphenol oxidase
MHGFLGRLGGGSRGAYESFNLSHFVGDDPQAVADNWERLRGTLPESIVFARVNQVHGNAVRVVTHADATTRPCADGMATREAGIILGIFTADCVPVLMVSRRPQVACALHAGWRGVLSGIAANGVRRMEELGTPTSAIRVALGPSIGPCCFEVDAELAGRFVREIPSSARQAREGKPGKAFLNLRGIIRDQLVEAGVPAHAITNPGPCTRCASDQYFSRRAAAGLTTGLQMSFVGFTP